MQLWLRDSIIRHKYLLPNITICTYSITDNSNQQSYSRIVQILVFITLLSIHIYLYIFAGHKEEQPTVSGNMKNSDHGHFIYLLKGQPLLDIVQCKTYNIYVPN
jgi:hypothetical protein